MHKNLSGSAKLSERFNSDAGFINPVILFAIGAKAVSHAVPITATLLGGTLALGVAADKYGFSIESKTEVQEESQLGVDLAAMVKKPLETYGFTFAYLNGEWSTIKTKEFKVFGYEGEIDYPASGKTADFTNMPTVIQTSGDGLDAYDFTKGELDQETNRNYIDVILQVDKLRHTVSYLESGYGISTNAEDKDKTESSLVLNDGATTALKESFMSNQGNVLRAACENTVGRLSDDVKKICEELNYLEKHYAKNDAKVIAAARQAGLEALNKCLNKPEFWQLERPLIESAIREILGPQTGYPRELWEKLIRISIVDKDGQTTEEPILAFKSIYDDLAKQGVLTWQSLEDQGYKSTSELNVTCTAHNLDEFDAQTDIPRDTANLNNNGAQTTQISYEQPKGEL